MSRVSYFMNLFDLLGVDAWKRQPDAAVEFNTWQAASQKTFPAILREFYGSRVKLRLGGDSARYWRLTLPRLWSEYSNMEYARTRQQILSEWVNRPERVRGEVPPGPYMRLITENQGNWNIYARINGDEDPPVYATELCLLSPRRLWDNHPVGWHRIGRFTQVVFRWFAHYYRRTNWVPLRFHDWGSSGRPRRHRLSPPKNYRDGIWLRSPREPFLPPVIDFLTERMGEPSLIPRRGGVSTYVFSNEQGLIRVTADAVGRAGGQSAWWLHAANSAELYQLGRLVWAFGTLSRTLTADTGSGRAVCRKLHAG